MILLCSILFGLFVTTAVVAHHLSNENDDLQLKLRDYENTNHLLKQSLDDAVKKCEEIVKAAESVPEDCSHGVWCKSCQQSRIFFLYNSGNVRSRVAVCNRANICKHHILKEEYNNAKN